MHLLSGAEKAEVPAPGPSQPAGLDLGVSEVAALKANVSRLEKDVAELKALIDRICTELGIAR